MSTVRKTLLDNKGTDFEHLFAREHRTHQTEIMNVILSMIDGLAKQEGKTDDRNEHTVQLAKSLRQSARNHLEGAERLWIV